MSYSVNAQSKDSQNEDCKEVIEEVGVLKYQRKNLQADSARLADELREARETLVQLKNIEVERDSLEEVLIDTIQSYENKINTIQKKISRIQEEAGELRGNKNSQQNNYPKLEKTLQDTVKFYLDTIATLNNELSPLKEEREELQNSVKTKTDSIRSLVLEVGSLKVEVDSLFYLRGKEIKKIHRDVEEIINGDDFNTDTKKFHHLDQKIDRFLIHFEKSDTLIEARESITRFKNNSRIIIETREVFNTKYNSTEVNSAIKNLNGLKNPSQAMIKEKNLLLQKLNNYCRMTDNTYRLIVDIDIYGSKRYKEEDLEALKKEVASYPYLIRALNQKKENGYKNGPVDLLPNLVKCN